jgi:hypothetical protein
MAVYLIPGCLAFLALLCEAILVCQKHASTSECVRYFQTAGENGSSLGTHLDLFRLRLRRHLFHIPLQHRFLQRQQPALDAHCRSAVFRSRRAGRLLLLRHYPPTSLRRTVSTSGASDLHPSWQLLARDCHSHSNAQIYTVTCDKERSRFFGGLFMVSIPLRTFCSLTPQ